MIQTLVSAVCVRSSPGLAGGKSQGGGVRWGICPSPPWGARQSQGGKRPQWGVMEPADVALTLAVWGPGTHVTTTKVILAQATIRPHLRTHSLRQREHFTLMFEVAAVFPYRRPRVGAKGTQTPGPGVSEKACLDGTRGQHDLTGAKDAPANPGVGQVAGKVLKAGHTNFTSEKVTARSPIAGFLFSWINNIPRRLMMSDSSQMDFQISVLIHRVLWHFRLEWGSRVFNQCSRCPTWYQ